MAERDKEKYKTIKERLDTNDRDTIISTLQQDVISESENHYYENIRPRLIKEVGAIKGILPKKIDVLFKSRDMSLQQYIDNMSTNLTMSMFQYIPFFSDIVPEDEGLDDDTKRVLNQTTKELLKNQIYKHNDVYNIFFQKFRQMLTHNKGILYVGWENEQKEIGKVKFKDIELNKNEENENINIEADVEDDTEIKKKDNLKLELLQYENVRNDPRSLSLEDSRFFYIYRYPHQDFFYEKYENYDEIADSLFNSSQFTHDYYNRRKKQTNEEIRRELNPVLIEMYIYDKEYHLLVDYKVGNNSVHIIDILIPKGRNEADKYLNHWEHKEFPVVDFDYKKMVDDWSGDSKVWELYPYWLAHAFMYCLMISGTIKKVKQPLAFNANVNPKQLLAVLEGKGNYVKVNDATDMRNAFYQFDLKYNVNELFEFYNFLDGKIQLATNSSDYQEKTSILHETLGGLEILKQEAIKDTNSIILRNRHKYEKLLYLCLSNIGQFLERELVVPIIIDSNKKYVKIITSLDQNPNTPEEIKFDANNDVFLLSNLLKYKYNFNIKFGQGNKGLRINELMHSINLATQYMALGMPIDLLVLVKELFELLEIDESLTDLESENEKIEDENERFRTQLLHYNALLKSGKINQISYNKMLNEAIALPKQNENHVLHLQKNDPVLLQTAHGQKHIEYLNLQIQKAQELQQQQRQNLDLTEGRNALEDGRTNVNNQPQPLPQGTQAGVNNA